MDASSSPDFRYFECINHTGADTIYPEIFDGSDNIIWDGRKAAGRWDILPGSKGATLTEEAEPAIDKVNERKYSEDSQNTASGTYAEDGSFKLKVDPPKTFDLAATALQVDLSATALRDAYIKLNIPGIAKLLLALANLISPELAPY